MLSLLIIVIVMVGLIGIIAASPPPHAGSCLTIPPSGQCLSRRNNDTLPCVRRCLRWRFFRLIKPRHHRNRAGLFRIAQKSVDFVICRPGSSVIAVIERDDGSHQRPKINCAKTRLKPFAPVIKFKPQTVQ